MNNTNLPTQSLQIAKVEVPAKIREAWQSISPAIFNHDRGVSCYCMTIGAWQNIFPQTIQEAIAMQTPSIGAVRFYIGEDSAEQLLAEMITTASLLINAGKNIRAEQIYPTAVLLLSNPEYRMFTVADFRLALNRGVIGKYGQVYDRFDISVLSSWLNAYWQERMEEAERIAEIQHSQTKAGTTPGADAKKPPEWFSKFLDGILENAEGPRKQAPAFQPDELILSVWKQDWQAMPDAHKPSFENYCQLQTIKMQKGKI